MIKFILSSKTILPLFDSHRRARNNSTAASLAHEDARACARKHTYSKRLVHGGQIFHVNCNGLCPIKGAFALCPLSNSISFPSANSQDTEDRRSTPDWELTGLVQTTGAGVGGGGRGMSGGKRWGILERTGVMGQ